MRLRPVGLVRVRGEEPVPGEVADVLSGTAHSLSKRCSSHTSSTRAAELDEDGRPGNVSRKSGPYSWLSRIIDWMGVSDSTSGMLPTSGRAGLGMDALAGAVLMRCLLSLRTYRSISLINL